MIRCYASRTGTRRNLAALRAAGWGLFVSAAGVWRHEGFNFWIECGAWSWWRKGLPFQTERFEGVLELLGRDPLCEAIIAPDIVCGGTRSLLLSLSWLPRLLKFGRRVYVPVQPGIDPQVMRRVLDERIGVFVGGDDRWKEETAPVWARLARQCGAQCHVGRVNTARRLAICQAAGVDSIDGSGPSRFEAALHEMEAARAVAVQVPIRAWIVADVFTITGEHDVVWVDARAGIEAILVEAADDGFMGEITSVQMDAGIWLRSPTGWRFDTWEQLAEIELADDSSYPRAA